MNRRHLIALLNGLPVALVILSAAMLLTACGGGEDLYDEHDVPTPLVDCAANPEACK